MALEEATVPLDAFFRENAVHLLVVKSPFDLQGNELEIVWFVNHGVDPRDDLISILCSPLPHVLDDPQLEDVDCLLLRVELDHTTESRLVILNLKEHVLVLDHQLADFTNPLVKCSPGIHSSRRDAYGVAFVVTADYDVANFKDIDRILYDRPKVDVRVHHHVS
eukprot:CAMPEP_0206046302 /NCGR_PEP_ID=MMETSP1466-20131121/18282_1 /ASSEMBLY_ACC=CAM_ASM_001126 /TAXON_ID=44452 /ORGANISM="Pavlova gyrans, Strain CCMP608" /LENGTH=163 /DNA_ID=CAMNT_0053421277 /DNA_START=277 /DNA_END=768 /DNA_ORIENTATION=+